MGVEEGLALFTIPPPLLSRRGADHDGQLHVLIIAEIHEHKLTGQTLFLA